MSICISSTSFRGEGWLRQDFSETGNGIPESKGHPMSTGRNPACWLEPRPPVAKHRISRQGPKQSEKASPCENITAGRI
jgi:hypothetical protein